MKVVAFGTFDILHTGHIAYLTEAKKLGDELVVVIARDSIVKKEKKREPIFSEDQRKQIIEALKVVDSAVLGREDDRFRLIEELKPDIVALGYDQKPQDSEIQKEFAKRGIKARIVRIEKFVEASKSSKIIEKIRNH
jgi:FAD synthetase